MTSSEQQHPKSTKAFQEDRFTNLIQEARQGSASAIDELLRFCQSYLLLVANQELGSHVRGKLGASDVVQETLARAEQKIGQFRGHSQEELLGWMRAILRNQIHDEHRKYAADKRNVERESPMEEDGPQALVDNHLSPRSDAIIKDEAATLRESLSKLSPDYRTVIILRNWEQLPLPEVARRMNRSEDAVKKLWRRAMKRLKQVLEDEAAKKM